MFDWFDKIFAGRREYSRDMTSDDMDKVANDMSKELKAAPAPEPEPKKPGRVFYRMGLTDNNRVSFSMYYGEITMNSVAVQKLIDQLEFYKSQLEDEAE
jgi:hypothetical protein